MHRYCHEQLTPTVDRHGFRTRRMARAHGEFEMKTGLEVCIAGSALAALMLLVACEAKERSFGTAYSENGAGREETLDDRSTERENAPVDNARAVDAPEAPSVGRCLRPGCPPDASVSADRCGDTLDGGPCNSPSLCEDTDDCAPPCPGCLIEGECIAPSALHPESACLICDPLRAVDSWSPNDGESCDDGRFCTVEDVCREGECFGAPRICDDDVACNGVSTCDEITDSCSPDVNQCGSGAVCDLATDTCVTTCQGCLIGNVCLTAGTELAGNPCLVCDPTRSSTSLTSAAGKACGAAANECSQQDTCDAQGICQANHLPPDTPCGNAGSGTCDQPDVCNGDGSCERRLATNGSPCDDSAFCTVGDQCQGGQCVAAGSRNCGANRSCNESTNQCQCTGCSIGNDCVAAGSTNPANACQICDPVRSSTSFSANINAQCGARATECSAQDTCNAQGQCAPNDLVTGTPCSSVPQGACQGGQCVSTQPPALFAHAPTGGVVGQGHYCVPRSSGVVVCWGANGSGEVGAGFASTTPLPPRVVSNLTNVRQVAVGALYSCALRGDGSVTCWGLGYGTAPVQITGISGAVQIASSTNQACAVLGAGRVRCWGANQSAAEIAGLSDIRQVAGGHLHLCAVRNDNTVWCWGANDRGQLGLGVSDGVFDEPVQAVVLSDVVEVALGLRHTCARLRSGAVECVGELPGLGAIANLEPVAVPNLTNAVRIVAGSGHLCALRSTGLIACIGSSPAAGPVVSGQLAALSLPDDATDVGAGINGGCALLTDSSIYCWGSNNAGELGDGGTGPDTTTPVRVSIQ